MSLDLYSRFAAPLVRANHAKVPFKARWFASRSENALYSRIQLFSVLILVSLRLLQGRRPLELVLQACLALHRRHVRVSCREDPVVSQLPHVPRESLLLWPCIPAQSDSGQTLPRSVVPLLSPIVLPFRFSPALVTCPESGILEDPCACLRRAET